MTNVISSIDPSQFIESQQNQSQCQHGSFDGEEDGVKLTLRGEGESHTRTVQALRKYLQRKLSSEDSSSERESPQEKDAFQHRSLDMAGETSSTLTCSIVYPSAGQNTFPLQKQRSLDDYSMTHDSRYLRTDLCVPILLSRCNFCDQSFELEDQLRAHIRESHWHYFLEKSSCNFDDSSSEEVLDLSMRNPTETGSLPNLKSLSDHDQPKMGKKPVVCIICGKGYSSKWNWKQHQKIHLRETSSRENTGLLSMN